ncbi:AAA family ATPase [Kineococcus arenarius]|uniref:AAA family ATPase n=1 Tax=unclassified Kineococcus TaxID=2621656 RepID=UPI003D7E1E9E
MITKLEVDGFKSFAGFSVDLRPFTAIVGANASGKSNIFDALTLLSRLVSMPVAQALAGGRGEAAEQFRRHGSRVASRMGFAVELLLDPEVEDTFGTREVLPHTRVRYEITLEVREGEDGISRPWVESESIRPLTASEDPLRRTVSPAFAEAHLKYGASRWTILRTEGTGREKRFVFTPRRAGESRQGHPRVLPAGSATASVLTSVPTADFSPLLYAVRREVERWRVLQLDPAALRQPSPVGQATDRLQRDGANLAWVLETIARASRRGGPGLDALAADLARVIRGFSAVEVAENDARGQWEVVLRSRDEGAISARVASDGTLRLLAVLAALYEPESPGVLCFEEPENGIQPARLGPLVQVLRDLVTDTASDPVLDAGGKPSPLVQLLVSSHSPKLPLTSLVDELVVVDSTARVEADAVSRVTRARRVLEEDEELPEDADAQLVLPFSTRAEQSGLTREEAERVVDPL